MAKKRILMTGGIRPAGMFDPGTVGFLVGLVDVRDVAQAHRLALELPDELKHELFIITADSPLSQVSKEDFEKDPELVLTEKFPGIEKMIGEGALDSSSISEWYTVEKAGKLLGYKPRYNFSAQKRREW